MGEQSLEMNISSIKNVDPYAKDIVDGSGQLHAVYMFDSKTKEWKKTAVEKALFIYSRNAEPYHGLFIKHISNGKVFVEPISAQTELKIEPPHVLTRNEHKRT